MSDWTPDTEDGGTIWTDGDVHELLDEHRREGESPNQCLRRVLGDEPQAATGEPEVEGKIKEMFREYEDQFRSLAREEADDLFEEKRRNHR
jgi:hypothetical protein